MMWWLHAISLFEPLPDLLGLLPVLDLHPVLLSRGLAEFNVLALHPDPEILLLEEVVPLLRRLARQLVRDHPHAVDEFLEFLGGFMLGLDEVLKMSEEQHPLLLAHGPEQRAEEQLVRSKQVVGISRGQDASPSPACAFRAATVSR